MIPYQKEPREVFSHKGRTIACFDVVGPNLDEEIVGSFGSEWTKFGWFSDAAIDTAAAEYFDIIPEERLKAVEHALDVGCGSGRWSRYLSKRVGFVESVDPSEAVLSAAELNRDRPNVRVTRASIDGIPFADGSFDLAICLGVIHHLPDPGLALQRVVQKVRPGGDVLVYVYYALDDRGPFFRGLFFVADLVRRAVSALPSPLKGWVCDAIAFLVYLPLVGVARLAAKVLGSGDAVERLPLAYYRNKSLREIRTDALDRFGTSVERRFTREAFVSLMQAAGLENVVVSPRMPFWHGAGQKPPASAAK